MRNIIIFSIISLLILLAGCQQKLFVCGDGSTVIDKSQCKREETTYEIIEEVNETEEEVEEVEEEVVEEVKEEVITRFEGDYYGVNIKNSGRGITLTFFGYYYIKKGEDFGKITGIKYSIKNNGAEAIKPSLKLSMINNLGERSLRVADVEREERNIEVGDEIIEESKVALSFNKLDIEKTLELDIYDAWLKGTHLFTVETKENFK